MTPVDSAAHACCKSEFPLDLNHPASLQAPLESLPAFGGFFVNNNPDEETEVELLISCLSL